MTAAEKSVDEAQTEDDSTDNNNIDDEDEGKKQEEVDIDNADEGKKQEEVICCRLWRRSYYLDVRRWQENGEIDNETYWTYGADSDSFIFN